jgi:hypothetical protein
LSPLRPLISTKTLPSFPDRLPHSDLPTGNHGAFTSKAKRFSLQLGPGNDPPGTLIFDRRIDHCDPRRWQYGRLLAAIFGPAWSPKQTTDGGASQDDPKSFCGPFFPSIGHNQANRATVRLGEPLFSGQNHCAWLDSACLLRIETQIPYLPHFPLFS